MRKDLQALVERLKDELDRAVEPNSATPEEALEAYEELESLCRGSADCIREENGL